ncbi:cytochrome c oxidase subunit 7A [Hyaloraphidium curvatum]|nr:cytochrome c oxidase subunit 7A [Hyaloraphidium curvatum]
MATIAPIVGKFRRQIIRDISLCLATGTVGAYVFWYTEHVPKFNRIDGYYQRLAEAKKAEN